MYSYSTGILTAKQADDFISWFDSAIGTETQTDQDGDTFYITCFELEKNEVSKCRYFEAKKLKQI